MNWILNYTAKCHIVTPEMGIDGGRRKLDSESQYEWNSAAQSGHQEVNNSWAIAKFHSNFWRIFDLEKCYEWWCENGR